MPQVAGAQRLLTREHTEWSGAPGIRQGGAKSGCHRSAGKRSSGAKRVIA